MNARVHMCMLTSRGQSSSWCVLTAYWITVCLSRAPLCFGVGWQHEHNSSSGEGEELVCSVFLHTYSLSSLSRLPSFIHSFIQREVEVEANTTLNPTDGLSYMYRCSRDCQPEESGCQTSFNFFVVFDDKSSKFGYILLLTLILCTMAYMCMSLYLCPRMSNLPSFSDAFPPSPSLTHFTFSIYLCCISSHPLVPSSLHLLSLSCPPSSPCIRRERRLPNIHFKSALWWNSQLHLCSISC